MLGGFVSGAMPFRLALLLAALAVCGLAPRAQAEAAYGYSRETQRVISQAFAATGGHGWYMLRGWHETGRRGSESYETWLDPVRYGMRSEVRDAQGLKITGFNGQAVWQVQPTGTITAVNDHATLSEARTEAFFAGDCYFFEGRFGARGDYLGVRRMGRRAYDVVRIQPWNGEPRELWFDAGSHLLGRIVDHTGGRTAAVRVSDYRKVGPVLVAFRFAPEPGTAASPLAREVQTLAFTAADRDAFSLNRPEALAKVQKSAAAAP
jgi:hypothetical protein